MLCILLLLQGQVHDSFKAKTSVQTKKAHGKMNSRAENVRTRMCWGRTTVCPYSTVVRPTPRSVVNTTGRPWRPLAASVPSLLECCILSFIWVRWTRLGSPVLGLLGLSCYSLDLVSLNFLLFSYNLAQHTQICNQNSTMPRLSVIGEI